jgi:hypothetical protein
MNAVKVLELEVKTNEVEGKKFYYVDLGERRNIKRIWINSLYFEEELKNKLGKYNETIGIFKNARIEKTSKGNHVIKKGTNNLFFILVKCGYRGSSEIKVISESVNIVNFSQYHSPNGNLGISDGVIVETKEDKVKIEWSRSGRLYGNPSKGISIIHDDSRIESVEDIDSEEIKEIDSV